MWIPIQLNETSAEPLYHQITVQLRALIVSGQLVEGTLLPSIRELAQQLKCSIITIRRVYQDLEAEGLLRTRQGMGTYVAEVEESDRDKYRLASVIPAFEAAVDAALRVQCTTAEMESILRQAIAKRIEMQSEGGGEK
ncbi:GntR family transcriptional regulator [Paenibacillus sp. GCM10012307]|uniref:GntR family transcriptional regulator n=1 Tax=Paenibacillus roseus TaxID=2798579 RepID=A0A934MW67_9BACL|nr:GntR family transcriptional regulator [Paenibacillus roseus]MBJ6362847.1 GntR family transcriptional regulator [Paenibacillus roseus]